MALCSDTSEFGAVVADYDIEHVAFRRVVDDFSRECLATVVDTSLGACASCANSNSSDLRGCARTHQPSAVNCRPAAPQSPSVEMEHVTDWSTLGRSAGTEKISRSRVAHYSRWLWYMHAFRALRLFRRMEMKVGHADGSVRIAVGTSKSTTSRIGIYSALPAVAISSASAASPGPRK